MPNQTVNMKRLLLFILFLFALSFIMRPRNTIVETLAAALTPFLVAMACLFFGVVLFIFGACVYSGARRNRRARPYPFAVGDRRGRVPAGRRFGWCVFTVSFFSLFSFRRFFIFSFLFFSTFFFPLGLSFSLPFHCLMSSTLCRQFLITSHLDNWNLDSD